MTQEEYTAKLEEILDDCFEAEPAGHFDYEKAIAAIQQLNNEAISDQEVPTTPDHMALAIIRNKLREELRNIMGSN